MRKWDSHKATEALWIVLITCMFAVFTVFMLVVNPFNLPL